MGATQGIESIMSGLVSDFFTSEGGEIRRTHWRRYWKLLRFIDAAADARAFLGIRRLRKAVERMPPMAVLLAAVQVPGREADLTQVIRRISATIRHNVTVAVTDMEPVGKFDNINRAIANHDLTNYDWLLIVDDDIVVPDGFLDLLLYFAHDHDLKVSAPAHKFLSYKSYTITERHWASLVRRVGFVESGPVTLLHKDTFRDLTPFPSLRWAWGIDLSWAQIAKRRGWKMGMIDAIPIRHLRPVAVSYDSKAAADQAIEFLRTHGVTISRAEAFGTNRRIA
jgi:hypothetical protein